MTPEQISGDDADTRGGHLQLRLHLFELTTGRPPFRGPQSTNS